MDVELELDITNEALECLDDGRTGEAATKLRQALDSVTSKLVKWEKLEIKFVQECTEDNLINRLNFLHSHGCIDDRYFSACNTIRKVGNIAVHEIQRAQALDAQSILENAAKFKQMLEGISAKTITPKKQRTLLCDEDCFSEPFELICEAVKQYFKNEEVVNWRYAKEKANIEVKKRIYESVQIFLRNIGLFYGVEPEARTIETIEKYKRLGLLSSTLDTGNGENWKYSTGDMTYDEEKLFIFNSVVLKTIDFNPCDALIIRDGDVIIPYLNYIYSLLKKGRKEMTIIGTKQKNAFTLLVWDGVPYLRRYKPLPFAEMYSSYVPEKESQIFSELEPIDEETAKTYIEALDDFYHAKEMMDLYQVRSSRSKEFFDQHPELLKTIMKKNFDGNVTMRYTRHVLSVECFEPEDNDGSVDYHRINLDLFPENEWSIAGYLLKDLNEDLRNFTDEYGRQPNRNLRPLYRYSVIEDTCRGAVDGKIEPQLKEFSMCETLATLFYYFYRGVYSKNRYEEDVKEIADQLTLKFDIIGDAGNAIAEIKQKQEQELDLLVDTLKEYVPEWYEEHFGKSE